MGDLRIVAVLPTMESDFCLQNVRTLSRFRSMPYSLDTGGCSSGHGAMGREADYSNTSATDVSGQPIGPICTGQALFLNMHPMFIVVPRIL